MIERRLVAEKVKEFMIEQYITDNLSRVGHSHTKLQRTPLGEKIVIFASRPGLIVGKKGTNIKKLTTTLKNKFGLENPQIEISEVENIHLDANIVAEMIAGSLERFGSQKFKAIGHKMMSDVINAGGRGVEILLSGKIPSARAKTWRFYKGYLKKCGDIAVSQVRVAYAQAKLKSGTVGVQVRIMPPNISIDNIHFKSDDEKKEEAPKAGAQKETTEEKTEAKVEQATKDNEEKESAKDEKPAEKKPRKPRKKKVEEVKDETEGDN
jgi:small subunit ribosomal protein S3